MYVVRVEAHLAHETLQQFAHDRAADVRRAAEQALSISGFHGRLLWPSEERRALCLIAEGDDEPHQLAEAFQAQVGGETHAWTVGPVPEEVSELDAEGRARVVIEMGLEDEGVRCMRCGAVPPHALDDCPFVLRDEGLAQSQDTDRYLTGPSSHTVEEEHAHAS